MNIFKNTIKYLTISSAIFLGMFLTLQPSFAQSSMVSFQSNPLFADLNIIPGDKTTKWVSVNNTSGENLNAKVVVDYYEDNDSLASQMNILINSGADIFYEDSLANFFSDGEANLSSVLADSSKVYDFTISFLDEAGNDYQGKSMNFDISISLESESGAIQTLSSAGRRDGFINRENEAPIVLGEEGMPELIIKKESSTDFTNPGTQLEYKVNIENKGDLSAFEVVLKDTLPKGFYFSSTGNSEKTWDLGSIDAENFKSITYLVDVTEDVLPGVYTNKASVIASNHKEVEARSDVEVGKVSVLGIEYELPATGFKLSELFLLILLFFTLTISSIVLKKNTQNKK